MRISKADYQLLKEAYRVKAYYIGVHNNYDSEDNCGDVVFAKNEKEARKLYWKLGWEVEDIDTCYSNPQFDKYADLGRVPLEAKWEAGWDMGDCWECGRRVDEDSYETYEDELAFYNSGNSDEDFPPIPFNPQFKDDDVFCSPECLEEHNKKVAEREAFREEIKTKYPGITNVSVYDNPPVVIFKFPGGKNYVTTKSIESTLSMCTEDVEAWDTFVESLKECSQNSNQKTLEPSLLTP